jgi:ribosomal protein S18 acetylase RimI-like enzyme
MSFFIRNYTPNDFDAVNNVWQQTDMGGAHRGDNAETIARTLAYGGTLFCLCTAENIVIGTAWITNDARRLYLHHFGILPQFQGKKLSHLLMEEVMEFAREKAMQIKLEVHINNIVASTLYEKYKFKYLGDYKVLIVRDVCN